MRTFVDKKNFKPVKAIIEHVRDGSTVRAFLLPEFYHITLMISGIRVSELITYCFGIMFFIKFWIKIFGCTRSYVQISVKLK